MLAYFLSAGSSWHFSCRSCICNGSCFCHSTLTWPASLSPGNDKHGRLTANAWMKM